MLGFLLLWLLFLEGAPALLLLLLLLLLLFRFKAMRLDDESALLEERLELKDDDFVVLGFPSHDFNQEADDEGKTAELCELTYGVEFPMFEPTHVKGDDADPLYRILAKATGEEPSWNFNKYLVDKNGKIVKHYKSSVKPSDKELRGDVEKALAM